MYYFLMLTKQNKPTIIKYMKYEKELILMVGPIGSGKSTLAKSLVKDSDIYISQDEQGKKGHFQEFTGAINLGFRRVIVDRMGFNKQQRIRYINPAKELGYIITIIEMNTPRDICFNRVLNRKKHPTIEANNSKLANKILDFYYKSYEKPLPEEYDNYNVINYEEVL